MIKMIIFDFDGVIEDNYEQHFELMKKRIVGITREEHRQIYEGNFHVEIQKFKDRDTGYNLKEDFSDMKKYLVIRPEIEETLVTLSQKYKLGFLTSAREKGTVEYLEANKITDLFAFVYGFETGILKSEKFLKIFKDFDVTKDECIFVTDTLGDIREANEVGVKTIALDCGYHERERLEKGKPMRIVSKFSDLVLSIEDIVFDGLMSYLDSARESIFRFEYFQSYECDDKVLSDWQKTGVINEDDMLDWWNFIETRKKEGVIMSRVRRVVLPMNEYTKMELHIHKLSNQRGDNISIIKDDDFEKMKIENKDFWMIDDNVVLEMDYTGDGKFLGFRVNNNVQEFIDTRNELIKNSTLIDDLTG